MKAKLGIVFILPLLIGIAAGCSLFGNTGEKIKTPITSHLELVANESSVDIAVLELTISSEVDGPAAKVILELPDGVILLEGQLEQIVALNQGVPQHYKFKVKLPGGGEQRFFAGASINIDGQVFGGYDALYLELTSSGIVASHEPAGISTAPADSQNTNPVP